MGYFLGLLPEPKPSGLIIIITISQIHLGPNALNLAINDQDATIVHVPMMNNRTANITEYTSSNTRLNNITHNVPRVHNRVVLVEVVSALVARCLQLIADSHDTAQLFAFSD